MVHVKYHDCRPFLKRIHRGAAFLIDQIDHVINVGFIHAGNHSACSAVKKTPSRVYQSQWMARVMQGSEDYV